MTDTTIAAGLAERIQSVTFDSLTDDALHWAKVAVLDTVGCTLAGPHEDCARIVGRALTYGTAGGACLVFGTNRRVEPLDAALINGTAAHALDYDDCSNTLGGHLDSWTHPRRLAHTNRPNPQSELDAKFSVQYCLARGLVDRRVSIEHFEGGSYRDPAVQDVLRRVHAAPHPDMKMDTFEHFGAEVKVTLKDGSTLTQKVHRPLGRGPENPLPTALLEAKFANCASRAMSANQVPALLQQLRSLETAETLIPLSELMQRSAR